MSRLGENPTAIVPADKSQGGNGHAVQVLGPDGQPAETPWRSQGEKREAATKALESFTGYLSALLGLDYEPSIRSRNPLLNHAWVYAAAQARATNLSQAPFLVFTETDEVIARRREIAMRRCERRGEPRHWDGPQSGSRRMAYQRHLTTSSNPGRFRGFRSKALELDTEHPLNGVFAKPNALMTGEMLWQLTELWMVLRGEAFWVLTGDDPSVPLAPGAEVRQIWVAPSDRMRPVKIGQRLVGWRLGSTRDLATEQVAETAVTVEFFIHEIVQFKYPNPHDPIRGLTPLSAAAMGIDLDLQGKAFNRSVMANGARPGDILVYEGELDPKEKKAKQKEWEDRHKQANRAGRLAILAGAWKHIPSGLTPQDMNYIEMFRWDRDEILAILRTPKTVLGVTEQLNFATQRGQDKNFWDKGLLPDVRLFEGTVDQSVMFNEPDDTIAAFDLSGVEALREGLSEQIEQVSKLTSQQIHMDPKTAFDVVGLPVPEYEGNETVLVSPLNSVPLSDVLDGSFFELDQPKSKSGEEDGEQPDENGTPEDALSDQETGSEPSPENPSIKRLAANIRAVTSKDQGGRFWRLFVAAQFQSEKLGFRRWRSWNRVERDLQLEKFDRVVKSVDQLDAMLKQTETEVGETVPPGTTAGDVMVDLGEMRNRLRVSYSPVYETSLQSVFNFTETEMGGIVVFELDNPEIVRVFDSRMKKLLDTAPKTLHTNVRRSLAVGIRNGETLPQLRQRIASVYKVSASSSKALQVARTETAGFMNAARQEMLGLQGVETVRWVTAGDENVRPTHQALGDLGDRPLGTNFAKEDAFTGAGGSNGQTLTHPNDAGASASEVINCRCVLRAVL